MSRTIGAALTAELAKAELNPIFLAKIETDTGTVFAWTGIGDLVWSGDTYLGTGIFGGFSPVEEATDGAATGIQYGLSGIPADMVSTAVASIRQGKVATLYFATLNDNGVIVGDPIILNKGFTDVPELEDGGDTGTIRLSTESKAIDQQRARIRRYTTEDQKIDDATDVGFEYVEGLQDRRLPWGRS